MTIDLRAIKLARAGKLLRYSLDASLLPVWEALPCADVVWVQDGAGSRGRDGGGGEVATRVPAG